MVNLKVSIAKAGTMIAFCCMLANTKMAVSDKNQIQADCVHPGRPPRIQQYVFAFPMRR